MKTLPRDVTMTQRDVIALLSLLLALTTTLVTVRAQVLTPPYFNLAVNRLIEATATCGVGVAERELFCKLAGAVSDDNDVVGEYEIVQGQLCDYCDPEDPEKIHLPENAVDGTERWWQSPPAVEGKAV